MICCFYIHSKAYVLESFSNKVFHVCLTCFISIFADQLNYALAYILKEEFELQEVAAKKRKVRVRLNLLYRVSVLKKKKTNIIFSQINSQIFAACIVAHPFLSTFFTNRLSVLLRVSYGVFVLKDGKYHIADSYLFLPDSIYFLLL